MSTINNKKQSNSDDILNAILGAAIMAGAVEQAAKQKKEISIREHAAKVGKELYEVFLGFQDAGFNEHQAFKMMLECNK